MYRLYRRWQLDGVWQAILTALQARATWPFASPETPRVSTLTGIQGTAAWISAVTQGVLS